MKVYPPRWVVMFGDLYIGAWLLYARSSTHDFASFHEEYPSEIVYNTWVSNAARKLL